MGTTSFNLGSNEKRTRVPSSTGMSSSGMTKGNGYVSAMQLPPIPVSSFMDSFEGQERSSLDLPPIPATKGYGSAIRTTQGSERRPHVLSHQQSDDTISDTIKSTQFNYGMSRKLDSNSKASSRQSIFNSTGTTSSTSSPDRLPTSRGLAQHRSSASSVRTSNTDQRSELGAGRRPPPGRLDLDSHNKISSSSVKTRASNSTDTAHRRIVTEPTQSSKLSNGAFRKPYPPNHRESPADRNEALLPTPTSAMSFDRSSGKLPTSPSLPLSAFGFGSSGNMSGGMESAASSSSNLALPPIPRSLSMNIGLDDNRIAEVENERKREVGVGLGIRQSMMIPDEENRVSLDSYHTKVSPTRRLPESESYSYLRTPSSKDPSRYSSHYLQSPSTPGPTDPSTLNRDDLVGVGELTTPRWKSGQTFPPTSNSAYEQSQQRVAPDTISKSGRVKASLFPSRRTKSIANSESYNSLVIEDRNPPVPSLPGSVTMPHTATLGGTLGRHGSGRVQGPRMRIPSGPAQRIVSGTQQDPDQRDDEQHRATNDRSTVSVNAALYGQATNRESGPDTMSSARVEQPGTPSRSSLRVNTSNGSPGSPYGTLKSNRRYSAKIAADLQALKVREANQSADRITLENNREALAVETATPVSTMFDIPFTGTTGSAVSSPKRFNQADVPGVDRPRLTSGNSTERTPSRSAKGEARRTPPAGYKREPRISFNQGRHSNDLPTPQAILKQLGSHRDFSHLPPSPSSASINKFMMRESASTNSFSPIMSPGDVTAENPVSGTGGSYPFPEDSLDQRSGQTKTTRKRKETNDDQGRGLDQETVDVLRKLDGLGKASSSSLKKQAKQDDGHVDNELAQAKTLSQRRDQGVETKRGRPEMTTPSSPAISKSRGTSASSSGLASSTIATAFAEQQALRSLDNAGASIANLTSQEGSQSSGGIAKGDVPPVPPLPNGYQSPPATIVKSPTLGSLPRPSEYALIKDDSSYLSPLASQANVERNFPTSASSPLLGSEASFRTADSKSPAMSSFSVFEPSGGDAERPRRMSKKWSFSSALSLGSHSQKSKVDPAHSTIASECSPQADEFGRSPSDSLPAHSGLRGVVPEDRTSIGDANAAFSRSGLPNVHGENNLMVPNDSRPSAFNKRSTSSGIPFFRRSSSSSSNAIAGSGLTKGPHHAGQEQPSTIKDPNNRKTILGVSMSLLKGSSSRRNLQRQPSQEQMQNSTLIPVTVEKPKHERKGSLGWARRKGKATEEPPVDLSNNSFSSRPSQSGGSADSRSIQRKASQESTAPSLLPTTPGPSRLAQRQAGSGMQLSRSGILPSIAGSPAIQTKLESGSPSPSINHARNLMSTTPTKIPRMTSKTSLVNSSGLSSYAALSFNKPVGSSSLPLTRERTVTGPPAVPMSNMAELGLADKPRYGTRAHLKDAAFELPRTDQSAASAIPSDINMHDRKASMHISNAQKRVLPLPPNDIDVSTATKSRVLPRDLSAASVRRTSLSGSQMSNGAGASPASTPIKADKHLASRLAVPAYSRVSHSTSNSHLSARSSRSQSPQSSMDEDELIGDKEMSTFFRQQQIKQSRGEIKSAEIEAMLNFPDPMGPGKEMTPHAFIKAHFESLSLYERREILDYQSIWYSGQNAKKNQATPESTHNNHGYDDERGDYIFIKGDHLAYRYEIMCLLGKGSFGQVLQCRDHKTGQCVAIKIIRNKKRFHHQALVEIKILENLVKWDPEDKHNLIKMTQHFHFRGHLCIVTELLSINLYEMVKANSFKGFTTTLIRRFTVQLLSSLQVMRNNRIIHCDLKPENILLRHPAKSGLKVIDFGSSCFENEKVYTYIQSRFYRSPEIILGLSYHAAIDMWSLGCIIAELFTGFPIFPGENEQEQLACIMEILGLPERHMVEKCSRKKNFFDSLGQPRIVANSKGKRRRPGSKTLSSVLRTDDDQFVDFIAKCLAWDPERRLKPASALRHPWIAGTRRLAASNPPPPAAVHSRLSSITGTPSSRKSSGEASKPKISEPSPLVARKTLGGIPSSSSTGSFSSQSSRIARPTATSRSIAQTAGAR